MKISLFCLAAVLFAGTASAQEFFIYPQNGQSAEQTEKDKFECYQWARNNSGFDPMAPPVTSTAPPKTQKKSGGVIGGAAVGAIGGKVFGSSKSTTRKSAAAGALIGGLRQSSSNSKEEQKRSDWEQRESANYANNRNSYNRAYSACLEGRGYTVK